MSHTLLPVVLTALGVGCSTVIGALIGFSAKKITHRFQDITLAFAAGVMLAAAVIGLIGSAVLTTGKTVFFSNDLTVTANILPFVISIGIFLLMLRLALKKVHPIWLVVSSAALGIAFGYLLEIPV